MRQIAEATRGVRFFHGWLAGSYIWIADKRGHEMVQLGLFDPRSHSNLGKGGAAVLLRRDLPLEMLAAWMPQIVANLQAGHPMVIAGPFAVPAK